MPRIQNLIIFSTLLSFSLQAMAISIPSEEVMAWRNQGQFFQYESHRIFYRDSQTAVTDADKPTVVLLHGFPTSSWDWHKLWGDLQNDYRLITLDFLGFGFSDKPRIDYSISNQADLVEQLLAHLAIKQAHLLVHDYGTYVSQELVARQQDATLPDRDFRIQSLVMLNGVVAPERLQLRPIQKALNSPFGWIVSLFVSEQRFSKNFSTVFGDKTQPSELSLQDYWYLITRNKGHRISHKLIHYYDESLTNSTRWVEALHSTDIPVMLITGLADPVAGAPMVEKFSEILPTQPVHVLPDIGHYPHLEDDISVAKYYRRFIHP